MGSGLIRAGAALWVVLTLHAGAVAQVECGASIVRSVRLTADLHCAADGLSVDAHDVVVDCDGHTIAGPADARSAGIRVADRRGVTIRNCTFVGFGTAVHAEDAPRLHLTGSRFVDQPFHLLARNSADARVERCGFEPGADHESALSFNRSPGARIVDNHSVAGVRVDLFSGSDDAVVEQNDLGQTGSVSVFLSSRVAVRGNRIGRYPGSGRDPGFAVTLTGADGCRVIDNQLRGRGVFLLGFGGRDPAGLDARRSADGNRIERNRIGRSAYGVYAYGASGNIIRRNEMLDVLLGVYVTPAPDDGETAAFPSTANAIVDNRMHGGQMAIQLVDGSATRVSGNDIRGQELGILDLRTDPDLASPNAFHGNRVEGSRVFGMVAYGSSPLVATNVFTGNGVEGAPLPEELTVLLNPVGAVRGGLALLPFAGWEASGFDDGDPLNDLLATPRIGGPGIENEFRGNGAVDVYALDTRPHSWETVEHDNHYLVGGAGLRLQQDWLGLIRVEDEEGLPVTGAAVSVADSTGLLVASFPSGEAGFAAAGADPDRPMRLAGPWTRFTEYVVSRSGKRAPRTPHRVAASAEGRTGRTCYSWDGLDNDPAGSYILNARYQTVVVRLSAADWSACHRSARR